ncbi:hypothetical protein HOY80DRAFT_1021747, partial [Tuber brumale]
PQLSRATHGGVLQNRGGPQINPTIDDFGITPINGEPNRLGQSLYTASQLHNHSPTLPRILLPSIKRECNAILDVCTTTGSIKLWIVPKSYGKLELRDA